MQLPFARVHTLTHREALTPNTCFARHLQDILGVHVASVAVHVVSYSAVVVHGVAVPAHSHPHLTTLDTCRFTSGAVFVRGAAVPACPFSFPSFRRSTSALQ